MCTFVLVHHYLLDNYVSIYYVRYDIWKEQVVLTRCCIGHSRLTHTYLLNNEERSECIPCNSNYLLKHVVSECVGVADVRQTFYNVNNLSNLFTNINQFEVFKRN